MPRTKKSSGFIRFLQNPASLLVIVFIAGILGVATAISLNREGQTVDVHAATNPGTGLTLRFEQPLAANAAIILRTADNSQEVGRVDVTRGASQAGVSVPAGTYQLIVIPSDQSQAPGAPIAVSIQPNQQTHVTFNQSQPE
ncbi:MAG TPA: hypothetical protein VFK03_03215 [Candidatus Saccharimonadales bacterium]|nr:hypothetical protein [Candidatus Saccharimonadales bacterium]